MAQASAAASVTAGNVFITGGTVTANGGGLGSSFGAGIGAGFDPSPRDQGSCVITGGSVSVSSIGPTPYCDNTSTTPACLTRITLGGITAETEISSLTANLSGSPYSYGVYDVRTDANGMLYLWLPCRNGNPGGRDFERRYLCGYCHNRQRFDGVRNSVSC